MNYSAYYGNLIKTVYITNDVKNAPAVERVITRLPEIPHYYIEDKSEIPKDQLNQQTLFITAPRGEVLGRCPGTKGHLCCNYLTIDLYLGCTFGCTYCVMKSYLNFAPITVYADTGAAIKKLDEVAKANPDRKVRVGTGEVGDSLQFDPLFELSAELVEAAAKYPNVQLELKTKSDFVDHLLDIPEKGDTVIGFSVNPPGFICSDEEYAAPLDARLKAAEKAVKAGYNLAFHFDPIINMENWEKEYYNVIEMIRTVPPEKIAWISLGTFRYTPSLREKMDNRPYMYDEFVSCRDGKFRYIQKIRSKIYRKVKDRLREFTKAPIYLCMESPEVWNNVFQSGPGKKPELGDIFYRVGV